MECDAVVAEFVLGVFNFVKIFAKTCAHAQLLRYNNDV